MLSFQQRIAKYEQTTRRVNTSKSLRSATGGMLKFKASYWNSDYKMLGGQRTTPQDCSGICSTSAPNRACNSALLAIVIGRS